MAKFEFDRVVAGEELKGMVQEALGSGFRFALKKNRIQIVQDAAKGCVIQVREERGKTICKGPYGYMPSGGLRIAIILGAFVLLFIIGQAIGYLVFGIGAIPMIILVLIMKAPSQDLVRRVRGVLEELTLKGADNSNAPSMRGQLGDMRKMGSVPVPSKHASKPVPSKPMEFLNCPHCNTDGVLAMSDGRCPNCKKVLVEARTNLSS